MTDMIAPTLHLRPLRGEPEPDHVEVVPMSEIVPERTTYNKKDAPSQSPKMTPAEARIFFDTYDPRYSGEPTGVDKTVRCPVCSRMLKSSSGFSPHWRSHLSEAEIVLGMPVSKVRKPGVGRMTKKQVEKKLAEPAFEPLGDLPPGFSHGGPHPKPKAQEPPASLTEGLLALLPYYLGDRAAVPVGRLHELHTWLAESERFINSLRR